MFLGSPELCFGFFEDGRDLSPSFRFGATDGFDAVPSTLGFLAADGRGVLGLGGTPAELSSFSFLADGRGVLGLGGPPAEPSPV